MGVVGLVFLSVEMVLKVGLGLILELDKVL